MVGFGDMDLFKDCSVWKKSLRLMSFVSVCSLYKFRASGHAYLETIIIACVSEVKDFSLCLSAAL